MFVPSASRLPCASFWRYARSLLLSAVWIVGFAAGCWFFFCCDDGIGSLMRGVVFGSVSIVCHVSCILLPFLISACAVFLSQPWLLLPVGFGKAFSFGFVSVGILHSCGSAGWFYRLLLMFTDLFCAPVLYFYLHRHFSRPHQASLPELLFISSVCVFIGSVEYSYILPFLAEIIK